MDHLTLTHRMASSILLILAMAYYSCEGKSIYRSFTLQTWKNPDFNLTNSMDSIHIFCGPSGGKYPTKRINMIWPKISCNSYIPSSICTTEHHDPRMVSFDGTLYSDIQVSGLNWIHCGMSSIENPNQWSNRKVSNLDLSSSGLTYLPSGIFRHFTSLRYLNLSSNSITGFDLHFSLGLRNLQVLDLSYNSLTEIDLKWMKHNTTLHTIMFSSNRISYIWPSEPLNQSLSIDLASNSLTCIDEPLEVFLKTNIKLNLNGNPLTCECMQSLRNGTYDNCTCENPTQLGLQKSKQLEYKETPLEVEISLKLEIIVGAAFLAGSFITFLFMYRNRSTLCRCVRYQHNLTELVIQPSETKTYENHAYIVCDDKDHAILKMLLLELEEKRHMKIVCDARDASPTDFQIAFIENCLSSSRRTIFVMSASFLDNKLCLYVLNLAASMEYLEQKCVIIILKVKPFTKEQEKIQEKLTLHKIWYELPSVGENSESFWNTLATAINDPKLHFQILGIHDSDNAIKV